MNVDGYRVECFGIWRFPPGCYPVLGLAELSPKSGLLINRVTSVQIFVLFGDTLVRCSTVFCHASII